MCVQNSTQVWGRVLHFDLVVICTASAMRKIHVTFYARTTSKRSNSTLLEWPGSAVVGLTKPVKTTTDRETVPLLMGGSTDGERGDAHVLSRSMMCMDIDCKPLKDESVQAWRSRSGKLRADFVRAIKQLSGPDGFDHAWHTTHSHDDEKRLGYRVWIPLAEDVPASQLARWRDAMHAMNQTRFNGICDEQTYNPERLMRLPALHPDRVEVFQSGARADGKLLAFNDVIEWYKTMPPELRNRKRGAKTKDAARIYSVTQDDEFALPTSLVNKLRLDCAQIAQGNQRLKPETRMALEAVAHAESLQKGSRDNGLVGLVGIFSNRFLEHEARPLLESLLLPVLEKTHADDPDDPIKPNMPDPGALLDWAVAQVESRRADQANPLGHTTVSEVEAGYIRDWTGGARSGGMAEQEFRILAERQGVNFDTFKRRLFVLFGKDTYVWQVNQYAPRTIHLRELTLEYAQAVLAGVGISRRVFDEQKSEFKPLALKDIMARHSVMADAVRASYLVPNSKYDERARTFVEAFGKRRPLTAERHDIIHEWLMLLGGDKLIDWVSMVPKVDRANSILLLVMKKNSGKNLFAHGLSRLWERGTPVDAKDAFADFNEGLVETPFIFADENLPRLKNGRALGDELRQIVSNPDVAVRRKFMPHVKCEGYVRMFIAANSDNPLRSFGAQGQQLTESDLEAIAERLLMLESKGDAAAKFLEKFGREEVDSWRAADKVAKHALWLAENHEVKEQGRRFAVEGNSTDALRKLVVGDELTSQVLDWFVSYALHPTKKSTSSVRMGFFSQGGDLYVSLSTIVASWQDFRPGHRMASTEPFLTALEAVSSGRFDVKRGEETKTYWRVKFDYLDFYAKRMGTSSATLRRAIMERDDQDATFLDGDVETSPVTMPVASLRRPTLKQERVEEI